MLGHMRISPFQGLRPTRETAAKVASLPYDVVSTEEARALAAGNPLSMLHVVRAEIDFPEGQDPYADAVYAKAVANFQKLQDEKALVRESAPCLYLYQQQMGDHVQRGIVAVCQVEDYENNLIKKHEKTRQAKEDDRTRLTSDLSANSGPVFLTFRDEAAIGKAIDEIAKGEPLFDFTAPDAIRHTVWQIPGGEDLVEAFKPVQAFYVADGHHRSASAARVGRERAKVNPNHTGAEAYNQFMAVIFPASELKILPYNRLVHKFPEGLDAKSFLAKLQEKVKVVSGATDTPSGSNDCRMYFEGQWYQILFEEKPELDPVAALDVSRLQDEVLQPFFGIDDPRTSDDISFVGGIRGTSYLKKEVDAGNAIAAFSLYPVTCDQLMAIADAGQIMPPKSTWFEPKLRSGLFIHTFENL